MDDYIIQNRYTRQEDMLREYAQKVLAKRVRYGAVLGLVLTVFITAASAVHKDKMTALVFAICSLIPLITLFIAPKLAYNDLLNKEKQIHGGKTDYETVISMAEHIIIQEDGYTAQAEYKNIIAVYYLEKSCVLMLSKTNGILLDVNGFSKGDKDTLKELIKSRCKNL